MKIHDRAVNRFARLRYKEKECKLSKNANQITIGIFAERSIVKTSKPKSKTYIVHHLGQAGHGGYTVLGRYKIGARNEKEAEDLLRLQIGKHVKVKVYYEDKESSVPHGTVLNE